MDEAAPPRRKRRFRGCLVRLLLLSLVLVPAAGWWANGPGFRWALRHGMESLLPERVPGLKLSADAGGTLWRGPVLSDVEVEWPRRGVSGRAARVDVRLDWAAAWRARDVAAAVSAVSVDGLDAVVSPRVGGREDAEPDDEASRERGPLRMGGMDPVISRLGEVWRRIDATEIKATDCTFALRDAGGGDWIAVEWRLSKPAGGTMDFAWNGSARHSSPAQGVSGPVSGAGTWDGRAMRMRDAVVLPGLAVEVLDLVFADAGVALDGRLGLAGGVFDFSTDLVSRANVVLAEGEVMAADMLDLVRAWLPPGRRLPVVDGVLGELVFRLDRPGMDVAQWEMKVAVGQGSWQGKPLPDVRAGVVCMRPGEARVEWQAVMGENRASGATLVTGLDSLPWRKVPAKLSGPVTVEVGDLENVRPWLPRALGPLSASGTVAAELRWSPPGLGSLMGSAVVEANPGAFGRWPWPDFRAEASRDADGRCSGVVFTVDAGTREPDGVVHVSADLPKGSPEMIFRVRLENPSRKLIDLYLPDGRFDAIAMAGGTRVFGSTNLLWRTGRFSAVVVEELSAGLRWRDFPQVDLVASGSWSPEEWVGAVEARSGNGSRVVAAAEQMREGRGSITLDAFKGEDSLLRVAADLPMDGRMPGNFADLPRSREPWQVTASLASHPYEGWRHLLAPYGIVLPDLAYSTVEPGLDLWIGGSPAVPDVSGNFFLNLDGPAADSGLQPAKVVITLATERGETTPVLNAAGRLEVKSGPAAKLTASLPLDPARWADDPDSFGGTPLSAEVDLPRTPLAMIAALIPEFTLPQGTASAAVRVEGILAAPALSGTARVEIARFPRPDQPAAPPLENIVLAVEAEDTRLRITEGRASLGGGRIDVRGGVDFSDFKNPRVDLALDGRALLVHRSDQINLRTDARLTLTGTPQASRLSGDLDVVQSLYIRDFEILPIGLAGTRLQAPSLPTFEAASKPELPENSILRRIALDLRISTRDPVLLRSNLAHGDLSGEVRIGGTAANPGPEGTIRVTNGSARLPFSRMQLTDGELMFRPEAPTDPILRMQGVSTVGGHRVRLFFFGPVSSPNLVLTSTPPLPEEEIMNLLATGATSSDLEGGQLAALKAAALLIDDYVPVLGMGESNQSGPLAWLRRSISHVDFQLGETDRLSGHQRSGARMRLGDRLQLDATVDNSGNERATIMYFFRIR